MKRYFTERSCASRPRHQTDGAPWPSQVGVCCRNGSEIASHAISAMLDSHPSFVDVALDIRNAFNIISRGAFFPLSHLTSLTCYRGLARCIGAYTYLFFGGKPDKRQTLHRHHLFKWNSAGLPLRSPALCVRIAPSPMCAREAGR